MDNLEKLYDMLKSETLVKNGIMMPELYILINTLDKKSCQLDKTQLNIRIKCFKKIKYLIKTDKINLNNDTFKKRPDYVKNAFLNIIDMYIKDAESVYHKDDFKYMCGFGIFIIILLLGSIVYLLYKRNSE